MGLRNRRNKEESEGDDDDWMATYADAITLLMAFFVMLVSFSRVDLLQFEAVQAGIKDKLGGQVDSEKPIFELYSQIQALVEQVQQLEPKEVDIGFDDEGIVIDFASGSFFESGSSELSEVGKLVLGKIKRELDLPPYDLFFVDAEGHTDNAPISTARFPSNWELSSARASAVVRFFIAKGMEPERLKAAGYADTKPKVPNVDIMGQPIPENQEVNRRVSIRLHP